MRRADTRTREGLHMDRNNDGGAAGVRGKRVRAPSPRSLTDELRELRTFDWARQFARVTARCAHRKLRETTNADAL